MAIEGQNDVDIVHDRLRDSILAGELEAGAEISQVRLAKEFGVSRTPLREALRMLQREGLIESEPHRQAQIASFSLPDLEELYVMRVLLEPAAVRLTIPRLDPDDVAAIEGDLAQMAHFAEQRDHARWEALHGHYHRKLTEHAGDRINRTLQQLSDHSGRYRRLMRSEIPRSWTDAGREHRLIADAVKEGDERLAARRLAAHLARTAFAVIDIVDPSYEPQSLPATLQTIVGRGDPWS